MLTRIRLSVSASLSSQDLLTALHRASLALGSIHWLAATVQAFLLVEA